MIVLAIARSIRHTKLARVINRSRGPVLFSMGAVMKEKYDLSVSEVKEREKVGEIKNYRFLEGGGMGKTSQN